MINPSDTITLNTKSDLKPNQFWCHLCQRQFRNSSALYQHGKRLAHLKRAMKISTSRCTTITNGKVTSSIQRNKSFSTPISLVHLPNPSSLLLPSNETTVQNQIIIRKHRHEDKNSYTCELCTCRCWSIRNMRRHIRLHADVRPYMCNICQLKFKSYSNLMKHLKTSRHQQQKETDEKNWTIDTEALEEQNKLINQVLIIDDENQMEEGETLNESSSSIDESNNLLEDLHIPDSRLIDGDAAELALIDPSTFEELHKAAECLLNLQGVSYFGEDENASEKCNPLLSS